MGQEQSTDNNLYLSESDAKKYGVKVINYDNTFVKSTLVEIRKALDEFYTIKNVRNKLISRNTLIDMFDSIGFERETFTTPYEREFERAYRDALDMIRRGMYLIKGGGGGDTSPPPSRWTTEKTYESETDDEVKARLPKGVRYYHLSYFYFYSSD